MLHLDDAVRVYVLFGCGVAVAVSILIVICFILPPSWACVGRRDEEEDDDINDVQLKSLRRLSSDACHASSVSTAPQPGTAEARWWRHTDMLRSSSQSLSFQSQDSGRHSIDDVDDAASVANTSISSTSRCGSLEASPEAEKCAHVTLHLQFDAAHPQLVVNVEHAGDLPGRTYMDGCDPSVTVRLERRSFSLRRGRRRDVLAHAVSPYVHRSRHPLFQYTVGLPLSSDLLKAAELVIQIDDCDKLVGTTEVGRLRVDLCDVHDALVSGARIPLTRYLSAATPYDKGDALVGLSFLPTSQRIAVEVVKFTQLPAVRVKDAKFKLVARVLLVNECGRVLKKRKTAPVDDAVAVEFNQVFQLDVGVDRWEHTVVLVVLSRFCHSASSTSSTATPPVYVHCGHVALGKHVTGHAHRIHWNSAFQNPRKTIAQWHPLN